MPHSDLHKQKRNKNLVILAMIVAFIALIWAVTMIRIAGG
jgi:predicted nucleic acid-binding Zn ribbon protein